MIKKVKYQILPVEKHPDWRPPQFAHATDAGIDLWCRTGLMDRDDFGFYEYPTGVAVEIPEGYFGLLLPRSSAHKMRITLANNAGVIDSGYRGEVIGKFTKMAFKGTEKMDTYRLTIPNPAIALLQLVIVPCMKISEWVRVDELTETERGTGGFGSTTV